MTISRCNRGLAVIDRRVGLAGVLAALLAPGPLLAAERKGEIVYIGASGDKLHAARFDPDAGELTALGAMAEGLRPTWCEQHPTLPILYVSDERGDDHAEPGGVFTFRADPRDGRLELLNNVRTGAGKTTTLWFDAPSSTLLTADFGGAVTTLPIQADNTAGALTGVIRTQGSGPSPRQAAPRPHAVMVDPTGQFALVPDLGADRVFAIPYDRRQGRLGPFDPAAPGHYVATPGSGPRHMAMHPNGRLLFLLCEFTSEVHVLDWNPAEGRLQGLSVASFSSPDFRGVRSGAGIQISRDGRYIYACDRGEHSLVVFAVDQRTGQLTLVQRIASGGALPWYCAIHPSGAWLLAANRDSNAVRVFRRDPRSGRLEDTGRWLDTPAPVQVCFLRA